MAVLTTSTFNLKVDDLIEAAHARIGGPASTGWEAESATRALGLLFQKMTVRGVNLWQLELATALTLTEDVAYVTLPADTVDVRTAWVYDTDDDPQIDAPLTRLSYGEYDRIPEKTLGGEPTQFFLDRQRDTFTLYVYPVPDKSTYRLRYRRVRKPLDSTSMAADVDAPARWYPTLVSGLAYFLSLERGDVTADKRAELKAQFEEDYAEAAAEDKETANIRFRFDLTAYSRI